MRFSSNGPRSDQALLFLEPADVLRYAVALLSTSPRALSQGSSMGPSTTLETVSGERLRSSMTGPRAFPMVFLFSSLELRSVDLFCNVSMSAATAARSFRKLAKLDSTEFKTSSHSTIDLCRTSRALLSSTTTAGLVKRRAWMHDTNGQGSHSRSVWDRLVPAGIVSKGCVEASSPRSSPARSKSSWRSASVIE